MLWRFMKADKRIADTLYRGIVARVRTVEEMRQLHASLGLKSMDPGLLEKLVKDTKNPADLAAKLRVLVRDWPDDFRLSVRLLDALEDAEDFAGARDFAERMRARPDLDARVRTLIGELYLRISAHEKHPARKADDLAAARRVFGEIVEFSPDDPVARRLATSCERTAGTDARPLHFARALRPRGL
jgi:Ca-activated chloride channel family protein